VLWPGKDPIGQCMKVVADTMPCTYVVGIAENIKEQSLSTDSSYFYYLSSAQFNPNTGGMFIRTRGEATKFQEGVRRRLQREMPGASYITITPLNEILGSQTRSWQLGATMFVAFGALALVLAAIGLYSVIAYNVAQRRQEIGVRIALGATQADIARLVVGGGMRLVIVGILSGGAIAVWAGGAIEPLLFRQSATDPFVLGSVGVLLLGVALCATALPALSAARVDPQLALRAE
jgi:putative ABC transport system permease protein